MAESIKLGGELGEGNSTFLNLCMKHCPFFTIILCTFQDLLNFDDPLNLEAAEHYQRDKVSEVFVASKESQVVVLTCVACWAS